MKLRNIFFFSMSSVFIILLILVASTLKAVNEVQFYRTRSISATSQLLALTGIRAQIRNQILAHYKTFLIEGALGSEDSLVSESALVDVKFSEYEKLCASNMTGLSCQMIPKLRETYFSIRSTLERAQSLARNKNLKEAKSLILNAHQNIFKFAFLKIMAEALEFQKLEMEDGNQRLGNSIINLEKTITTLVLLALILTTCITYWVSYSIGRRVSSLADATKKIAVGNYDVQVETDGNDEISHLSKDFVDMVHTLNETKKKLHEQQLHIIATSKLSALGEMAGEIAHEINTPLAVIQLSADLLERKITEIFSDRDDIKKPLASIQKTVARIAKIVKGLRNMARDGTRDPMTPTLLSEIMDDTVSLCAAKMRGTDTTMNVLAPKNPVIINCRSTQISQVIINLVNNACDAIQNNEDKWIRIEIMELPQQIEIRVTDSGLGIPLEIQSKMMEPFFTTKGVGHGTGLGLSISRNIIEEHQGDFFIDANSPNTCFVIRLPKTEANTKPMEAA